MDLWKQCPKGRVNKESRRMSVIWSSESRELGGRTGEECVRKKDLKIVKLNDLYTRSGDVLMPYKIVSKN